MLLLRLLLLLLLPLHLQLLFQPMARVDNARIERERRANLGQAEAPVAVRVRRVDEVRHDLPDHGVGAQRAVEHRAHGRGELRAVERAVAVGVERVEVVEHALDLVLHQARAHGGDFFLARERGLWRRWWWWWWWLCG